MTTPAAAAEEKNLRRESGLTIAATKEEKEVCLNTNTTNQPALKSVTNSRLIEAAVVELRQTRVDESLLCRADKAKRSKVKVK